jgi:NDP-sugar pyrophosphorylase family protein
MPTSMPRLALLAGGLATRLRPLTEKVPKSMLPVAGEPFIAHQLRLLARQGVREIVVCVGYLGEQVQEYTGDGSAFGCHVEYVFDGDKLKGTGGAIKGALPLLGDHFFIMYGDSYLPTSFARVHDFYHASGLPGLMTVFHNENKWDVSNVDFQDGRIVNYDKRNPNPEMKYIDYGLGILRAETLAPWGDDEVFDLARVYESLVSRGQLAGLEIQERFFEIGSHKGLDETDGLLLELQREKAELSDRTNAV